MLFLSFVILCVFCVRNGSPSTWIHFSDNHETEVLPSYSTVRVTHFVHFDDSRTLTTSIFRGFNNFGSFIEINLLQRFGTQKCQISTKKHVFSLVPIVKACDKPLKSHLQLATMIIFKGMKTLLLPSYPYITNSKTCEISTFLET